MNKSLVALIGTLIAAATMFASSAEAGLKIKFGFGGGFPAFHSHNGGGHAHRHYQRKRYVARRVAKKTVVAKKSTPSASKVAKIDKKASKPEVVATASTEEKAAYLHSLGVREVLDSRAPGVAAAVRDPAKVATCFYDSEGKDPEPLIAIWEPKAYPLMINFYKAGKISPRDFLKMEDICILQIPDRNALVNINSPEELKKFRTGSV